MINIDAIFILFICIITIDLFLSVRWILIFIYCIRSFCAVLWIIILVVLLVSSENKRWVLIIITLWLLNSIVIYIIKHVWVLLDFLFLRQHRLFQWLLLRCVTCRLWRRNKTILLIKNFEFNLLPDLCCSCFILFLKRHSFTWGDYFK